MTENRNLSDSISGETNFEPAGTLPKPGPIGRLVRLLFGLAIVAWLLPGLFLSIPALPDAAEFPTNLPFWGIVALTLVNMYHVVNLGLGKSWGHQPQGVFLALVGLALVWSVAGYGRIWAPPFAALIVLWLILINLPLGIAFLLSASLATPGCEMRSYNHLIAKIQRTDPTEHFCPGGVDFADRWELKRR